jgi:hypothetical protein
MNFRRRIRILESRKSPSTQMMKRTYNRALLNGGVVQDFTANVENLRVLSRALGYDNVDRGGKSVRKNMIQWSESFDNSLWIRQNTAISINVITAPDGNTTAEKFIANSTNAFHLVYQLVSGGIVNTTYTASMYAKAGEVSNIAINNSDGIVGLIYSFDLISGTYIFTNGTIGTSTASITNVGNGWWRCSVTRTMGSTIGSSIGFQVNGSDASNNITYAGDNVSGLYLWGFQYEKNIIATEYQSTTTSVVNTYLAPASFTYVPSSYGESKNFTEVHNKRNLFSWSEDFNNNFWNGKLNCSILVNALISPNGTLTADKLQETSGTGQHQVLNSGIFINQIGDVITFSVYAKSAERTYVWLTMNEAGVNFPGASFNLSNGSIGNSVYTSNPKILDVGDGWYRCSISRIVKNAGYCYPGILAQSGDGVVSYTGITNYGIYIWGAQLEKSNGVGMYLPKTNIVLDNNVDFTFTRATPATITNKQGVLEDSCYNLFTNSEVYTGSNWTKESMIATANATIAPGGALTATKIASTTAGNYCRLYPTSNTTYINNTYTYSFYVKAAELNFIHIRTAFASSNIGFCVNLTNAIITAGKYDGTLSSTLPTIYSAKLMPGGWVYVSYTVNVTASISNFYIHISDSATSTANSVVGRGVYFGGSQISLGSLQRAYLKTTNRLNVPRLDYSRGLYKSSLLTERSATNLFLQSEDISTGWSNDSSVVKTLNATASPDGRVTADKLAEFNGTGAHNSYRGYSVTAGIKYTISGYFKPAGRNNAVLSFNNSPITNSVRVNFNLTTGLVNTPIIIGSASYVNSKMTLVQQGFYRCEFTAIAPVSATYYSGISLGINDSDDGSVRVGDGVSGLYVWGMQLEVNSLATTYIPTTTTIVTRNDEINYVDLWNNAMLNKNNWTLFWEGYLYDGSGSNISFALSDTTAASSDTNQIGWDSYLRPFYNISNTRMNSTNGATNSTINKYVIQYNNGVVNFYINGINTWSNQSVPVFDYRYLVLNSGGSTFATDKICLWPRTLSNIESIKLSTRITPISDQPWYLASDMKFYLKFNNNLNDQTGFYNNGVANNILYNSGLSNNLGLDSAIFNGTSSYIQMPDTAFYADTQTVSFWAKSNSLTSVFYTLGSDINGGGWGLVVGHTLSGSSIGLVTASPVVNNNYTGVDIKSMNEWFHMALVYDNTLDVSRTYVNGSLIASKSLGVSNLLRGSSKVAIGRNAAGAPSGYTNGEIADFAVIKRVLTLSEIQSLQKPI